ncbi:MAG: hypothetical protein H0Z39_10415 [Peptococcaceae bacterium]|nr:hypothetical protein [Peptococcaceae bacterium]
MVSLKFLLLRILILPIFPAFAWGPFTHPVISKKALEKAENELAEGNKNINRDLVERIKKHEEVFLFASNSADAISVYHILSGGLAVYDYAHNHIPDNPCGKPEFGYKLIHEYLKQSENGKSEYTYDEKDLAVACGWLSHQLADWYTQYPAVDTEGELLPDPLSDADGVTSFFGYANSHRVLGPDYHPVILERCTLADHALVELFHDMLILEEHYSIVKNNRVELFNIYYTPSGKSYNLLTQTSEQYRGIVSRIPCEDILELRNNFNFIINGIHLFIELLKMLQPSMIKTVYRSLDPRYTGKPDYIVLSINRVVEGLFQKSYDEIAKLAQSSLTCELPTEDHRRIKARNITRAGTILFGAAYQLGKTLSHEAILPLINDKDSLNIKLLWGAIDLRFNFIKHMLRYFIANKLPQLTSSNLPMAALLGFLGELLKGKHDTFEGPRREFRKYLKPLITLPGPADIDDVILMRRMIERGLITVKITPATYRTNPTAPLSKQLDPDTLKFRINGYHVSDLPERYELKLDWDNSELIINCRIRKPLCPGYHHIYIEIQDHSGIRSQPLEMEIHIINKQPS